MAHGNGMTIGFKASRSELVDAWHAAGVANGGTTCENPPGLRVSGDRTLKFVESLAVGSYDITSKGREGGYNLKSESKNWFPSKEQTMLAEQILFEGGKVLNIGFVNLENNHKRVYIIFHGT